MIEGKLNFQQVLCAPIKDADVDDNDEECAQGPCVLMSNGAMGHVGHDAVVFNENDNTKMKNVNEIY